MFILSVLLSSLLQITPVRTPINDDWRFALGHAADQTQDFGYATEYFNFFTKANSIHNAGPYAVRFDDSDWSVVSLPHDWAASLPFAAEASHSHGYRTIGWKYPQNSVGWYRRLFSADTTMIEGPTRIVFDGIFRDARVWVNGFYLGHEESGYTRHCYDIAPYLNLGDSNVVCVRVDATYEEGWWYEGAGIYRKAWIETGKEKEPVTAPETASYTWSADSGFMVNNRKFELHGVNLHQDHAGVGTAITKGLWEYRLRKLMQVGVNAIRCSHNPASEDFLDLCDSLGLYVIEETRLMGVNKDQRHVLEQMIRRDMHHKCIILWSVGNEEWGIEWSDKGDRIGGIMTEWVHEIDPSRPVMVATSSGPHIIRSVDVAGYNYMMQNDIDGERARYPQRIAVGSEETTGCGTRGVYFPCSEGRAMPALNRTDASYENIIERGWRFYDERPWLAGLFYWTGFDYLGEPNPLSWPAVGSEFGLFDACGFAKDEVYYLQSWWTNKPTLHVFPHWNLQGHEGETIPVWIYSNMEEVELFVNGKSLGKKAMPHNGHLSFDAVYQPGKIKAVGYKHGKKVLQQTLYTAGQPTSVTAEEERYGDTRIIDLTIVDKKGHFCATSCDTIVCTLPATATLLGVGNGNPASHDVMQPLSPSSPSSKTVLRVPAFNGHAQLILSVPYTEEIAVQYQLTNTQSF